MKGIHVPFYTEVSRGQNTAMADAMIAAAKHSPLLAFLIAESRKTKTKTKTNVVEASPQVN